MESVKLSLRRGATTLGALNVTKGSDPVLVGRSHECALRVPAEEQSVSGKHARFFWKGSSLFVEDAGSRNGIFHDGVQLVKPRRVRYDDLYALGNCQIAIGPKESRADKSSSRYHRLEFLNGDRAGKTVDIRLRQGADCFSIGLDPGCDINLPDMLVSRKHALLKVQENEECWIEDAGSRNGTYVNGERLETKSRLLKHGDKISIAYFDLRFLDRNVRVTRVNALRKLAVVAVTFCFAVGAYLLWLIRQPGAEEYVANMRECVASENFEGARQVLKRAMTARDASAMRAQLEAMGVQLELWERTYADWAQARRELEAGKIDAAGTILARLGESPIDAWAWKPETMPSTRQEVEATRKAMRLYFDGCDAIAAAADSAGTDSDKAVRKVFEPVSRFIAENGKADAKCPYLKPLMKRLRDLRAELEVIRRGFDVVDASIARISLKKPDFSSILVEIAALADDTQYPPAVREYARRQLEPCKAFLEAQRHLEKQTALLTDMNFDAVLKMERQLPLPSQELCASQAKYSDVRALFQTRHETLLKEASSLGTITQGLRDNGIAPGGTAESLTAFASSENWRRILSFDCLKKRPPSMRRTEPASVYDEMIGIEFTYESLRAMPNVYNGHGMRMVGFLPKCISVRKAFELVETFILYLDAEERKRLQTGALGRFYTMCVKIAIAREEMVTMLKSINGSKRAKLVAAFYAEYFTARPSNAAKRLVESQFTVLKREVAELADRYAAESNPDRQIQLRTEILELGLPGDPTVHTKWVQAFN